MEEKIIISFFKFEKKKKKKKMVSEQQCVQKKKHNLKMELLRFDRNVFDLIDADLFQYKEIVNDDFTTMFDSGVMVILGVTSQAQAKQLAALCNRVYQIVAINLRRSKEFFEKMCHYNSEFKSLARVAFAIYKFMKNALLRDTTFVCFYFAHGDITYVYHVELVHDFHRRISPSHFKKYNNIELTFSYVRELKRSHRRGHCRARYLYSQLVAHTDGRVKIS